MFSPECVCLWGWDGRGLLKTFTDHENLMDIECHGQIDNENIIHFYIYFLYFIIFLLTKNNRTLNFYLDVEMSKLFLKCKFRKKSEK